MNQLIREVAEPIRKLYQAFLLANNDALNTSADNAISVNEVVGHMALVYEKLRNLMNDADEHLFRKNAIRRYLARKDFFANTSLRELAQLEAIGKADYKRWSYALICELIRAKYLPNKKIPEKRVAETAWVIEKNILIRDYLFRHIPKKNRKEVGNMILELAANEIEEILAVNAYLQATIGSLYELLRDRTVVQSKRVTKEFTDLQLYIAILRSVLHGDKGVLQYHLFTLYFPKWKTLKKNELTNIIVKFIPVLTEIEENLSSEINQKIAARIKSYAVCYDVLREFSHKDPKIAYRDIQISNSLRQQVRQTLNKRYKNIRTRLFRSAWRSVVYIFITKMMVALMLEIPYDKYIAQEINYLPLIINIFFPSFLMFLLTITVRIPAQKNTAMILEQLNTIIFKENNQNINITIRPRVKLGFFLRNTFRFLYFFVYALILWLVITTLLDFGFNAINILIFVFFLFLISFFAIRIRNSVQEIVVLPRKENILTFFIDIVGIPLIRAGRWMNYNLSKINIFVFIMDFIIEAPFKVFLEVIEGWVGYLREKREEVY